MDELKKKIISKLTAHIKNIDIKPGELDITHTNNKTHFLASADVGVDFSDKIPMTITSTLSMIKMMRGPIQYIIQNKIQKKFKCKLKMQLQDLVIVSEEKQYLLLHANVSVDIDDAELEKLLENVNNLIQAKQNLNVLVKD